MLDFILQFLCAIPLLLGLWLMGNKRLLGPFLAFLAEGFTTIVGLTHHVWSIVLIGVVLFVVQGRNFLKWKREGIAWALLLGISLSGSFERGALYQPQWFAYRRGVQQETLSTIDATSSWIYLVPSAGGRNPNVSATLTLTWGQR